MVSAPPTGIAEWVAAAMPETVPLTLEQFIAKWKKAELKERAAAQEHFLDLCRLLEHPTPAEAGRALDATHRNWLGDRSDKKRTLTALYNERPTWLRDAHRRLDVAVFEADGWDGVNVASLGLMATVTWQLGRAALVDWVTVGLALAATVLVFRLRINSAWLVLGGGCLGVAAHLLR